MPQPWTTLPATLTRRCVGAALSEALGALDLANLLRRQLNGVPRSPEETRAFDYLLMSRPE